MDAILELAASRGIAVLEDAAESFASRYRGSVSGTLGTMGTFSFQATKTITTGEGGMVVTADRALHDRLCLYRSHGMSCRRYWHDVAGHNFRLTNFQAAMGCAQLEKLDEIIDQRRRVHRQYVRHLANLPGLFLQVFPPEVDPVLWAMAVKLEDEAYPQGRDQVIAQLAERQIETRNGFYAPSQMGLYGAPPLPVCEDISRHVISLPTFPTLTDEQIEYVCRRLAALRK
jgi:perosamine synthetase